MKLEAVKLWAIYEASKLQSYALKSEAVINLAQWSSEVYSL